MSTKPDLGTTAEISFENPLQAILLPMQNLSTSSLPRMNFTVAVTTTRKLDSSLPSNDFQYSGVVESTTAKLQMFKYFQIFFDANKL